MRLTLKLKLSIGLIWLFAVSGAIGILSPAQDWFLLLTPLNLFLSFFLVIINIKNASIQVLFALLIPFFIGFITEALGVNYGLIFGTYTYGENLGYKVLGVPLIICVNWAMLTVITADSSKFCHKNILVSSIIGAVLMTVLDILLEVSAPRFDFWEFQDGVVPLQNYLGWLIISFIVQLGYQAFKIKTNKTISYHLLISMTLFFFLFIFF